MKKYFPLITGLVVFIVYLFTIAPTALQIDAGELAAVQSLLGIAHPTGYPLFTLLGYVFLTLPTPFTEIFMANLLAAIWCSIGIIFFIKSAKIILDEVFGKESNPMPHSKINNSKVTPNILSQSTLTETVKILIAVFAGLITAFSKTIWMQSTSVEVYSLHLLLINMIIYFLLKAYYINLVGVKQWLVLALMLALGFSNHMTTILIIPGTALLFFMKEKFGISSLRKLLWMLLLFFIVLILFYAYLPIRASQNPVLNWGNPVDLERLLRHVTGQQYQVWIFSSVAAAKKQLAYFAGNLATEFTIPVLFVILVGLVSAFNKSKRIFSFILISFFATVLYAINYDINDIDSYFLLAYVSLGFFSLFGIASLVMFFFNRKVPLYFTFGAITLLLGYQVYTNFSQVDQSDTYIYEDYTKAVISSTEQNSIIFSYQWDYFISQSYYFQKVENFRNDVVIIDKELLRRSWYYNQIRTSHPEVAEPINDYVNKFLEALAPFEKNENFDSGLLETYYRKIMTELVATNIEHKNYYIGLELVENEMRRGEFTLPAGYNLVPHLLTFKVVKGNEYTAAPDPDFIIRFPKNTNKYVDSLKRIIATMLINRTIYEIKFNKPERARIYAAKVTNEFPEYKLPQQLIQKDLKNLFN